MKIFWSELSENQLRDIFDYHECVAGRKVASRLISELIKATTYLSDYPHAGQKENLLEEFPQNYKYIVHKNYKIIYWINQTHIVIASVFDCRQNPEKIKKTNTHP